MSTPRFVDGVSASVDMLNDLLQTYMPLKVDWTMGPTSSTLQLVGLTTKIENAAGISVTATSETMPRTRLDPLRVALREILQSALMEPTWSTMGFGIMMLQLGEEAVSHLEAFQDSQQLQQQVHDSCFARKMMRFGWDATSTDWKAILSNPLGVNPLTVNDTAKFLLGKSISQIILESGIYEQGEGEAYEELEDPIRLLHVESVFRGNLVAKFTRKRQEMRERLASLGDETLRKCVNKDYIQKGATAEDLAEILCTPEVTFHGAPRNVMQSIVRYGFVIPGQKIGRTGAQNFITCGASFGVGIYSSPHFMYAARYADHSQGGWGEWNNPADIPGFRVLVCATLMGRPMEVTRDATRRTHGLFDEKADSHISPNECEYIVFDSAQIIPCYVLHLDYSTHLANERHEQWKANPWKDQVLQSRVNRMMQGKAKKDALKAAATKWFPYGFGSATGTNFVIEEIADVSDDEEEYGAFEELQELRGQRENEWEETLACFEGEKVSWFDEFQDVRATKKQVRITQDEWW